MITRCVLSGSFHREPDTLERLYRELALNGCQILSPHRIEFKNTTDAFVKDPIETNLSSHTIEQHHLLALCQSDFMWLHCPKGYIGSSAAFEIGVAYSRNIPIFSNEKPTDKTLSIFVTIVPSVFMALEKIKNRRNPAT